MKAPLREELVLKPKASLDILLMFKLFVQHSVLQAKITILNMTFFCTPKHMDSKWHVLLTFHLFYKSNITGHTWGAHCYLYHKYNKQNTSNTITIIKSTGTQPVWEWKTEVRLHDSYKSKSVPLLPTSKKNPSYSILANRKYHFW